LTGLKNLFQFQIILIACLSASSCKKEGCRDEIANNFNPEANVEDYSCTYEAEKMAGTFQVEGYKIAYQTTDTTHYTYTLEVSYLEKNKALITNLGGMNQSIEIELYDYNSRIEFHISNSDSLGIWSGFGTYYDSNSFGISYIEGIEQNKHIDLATR
jgi:hypothetical protein